MEVKDNYTTTQKLLTRVRDELINIKELNAYYHEQEQERHKKWQRSKRVESVIGWISVVFIIFAFGFDVIQVEDLDTIKQRLMGLF